MTASTTLQFSFFDLTSIIAYSKFYCCRLQTDLLEVSPHPNVEFTPHELRAARYSIACQSDDLQRRIYQTRITQPGPLHRVVTMESDNINPGIRYY